MRNSKLDQKLDSAPTKHPSSIMLVDDDELVLSVLGAGLSEMGYLISTFERPQDALDNYQDVAPDLVIVDFEMPGMDGADLAEKMLSQMYRPIIVLSVRHDDSGWSKAVKAGVLNYLVKPVSAVQLRPAIETTLSSYRDLVDFIDGGKTGDRTIPGSAAAVLDQLGFGVVLTSNELIVSRINFQAKKMMGDLSSLDIQQDQLKLLDVALCKNFNEFAASEDQTMASVLHAGDRIYPLFIRRLTSGSFKGYTFFLLNPKSGIELSDDLLSVLYGLTGREVRIAKSISSGNSIEDYCACYFVSTNTAKTQLKSVFAKVGVHSQAELVSKLAALADPLLTDLPK
ncbi:MAG: response regulator [Proteobacteria bacterium]|jgi:DNA-binding NarL/FixJ family response regulator|nr:response regulator [Pseudomonadota bacterium]